MKIKANGIDVNYTIEGPEDGPVVTLSHSLAANLGMWEPQAAALRGHYRVLRYDTRGHGQTSAPPGDYALEQLADDVRTLLDALGIARTHYVGLSMGGMIGQTLALRYPDLLDRLVLCDTSSAMPPGSADLWNERIATVERDGMEALVTPTIERWFTPGFIADHDDQVEPVRQMIRATPVAGYAGCGRAIMNLNLTDRLGGITAPTLAIVGEDDIGTPVSAHEVIRDNIPGAMLVVLPSAMHLSNIEQAEKFNAALLGFRGES
ncbi:MAG: 3-oxoadipate enol-lactonase [Rhodospirillales bacterium]|nr:3-oxoadipate enol-lactonase [Rhodospirillales bacterium]